MLLYRNQKPCIRLPLLLLILMLAASFLGGCSGQSGAMDAPELLEPVKAASGLTRVMRGDLFSAEYLNASVVPYTEKLHFTQAGIIEQMPVTIGDYVKKGDVLLVLDQEELVKSAALLEEELAYTKEQYEYQEEQAYIALRKIEVRLQSLRASGGAQSALDQAGAAWEIASNNLEQMKEDHALSLSQQEEALEVYKAQLDQNQILAPFDGRVVDIKGNMGQWVDAYVTMVVLADEKEMIIQGEAYSNATLKSALKIEAQMGQEAYSATYLAYEDAEYTRKMIQKEVLPTRFVLQKSQERALEYGEGVTICVYKAIENDTLYLPSAAIHRDEVGSFVYQQTEGRREKVYITIGVSNATYTQVLEGLEEGDEIYETE